MILKKTKNKFESNPYLTIPIDSQLVETLSLKDFDKDGYEVATPLELAYYKANGIELNDTYQYHITPTQYWYTDAEDSEQGVTLDHAVIFSRYAFAGKAREQLEQAAETRPILNKLLTMRPKWGLDFNLEYVSKDLCMEIIHFEYDYFTYEEAKEAKEMFEQLIDNTDWNASIQHLINTRSEWQHLNIDDQSDFKARYFGLDRAYDIKKVF
jgi:hypothetical protein